MSKGADNFRELSCEMIIEKGKQFFCFCAYRPAKVKRKNTQKQNVRFQLAKHCFFKTLTKVTQHPQ